MAETPASPSLFSSGGKRFDTLVRLLLRTTGRTGDEALAIIVHELGQTLGAARVHLSIPAPDRPGYFQSLAHWPGAQNFTYPIENTASLSVWTRGEVASWDSVARDFPSQRAVFEQWASTSLVGQRLDDATGEPLGVLVAMFGPGIPDHDFVETVIRLYSLRLVGELERRRRETEKLADERLRLAAQAERDARDAQFRDVFEHSEDAVLFVRTTAESRPVIERANARAAAAAGCLALDMIGRTFHEIYPPAAAAVLLADFARCVRTGSPLAIEQSLTLPAGVRVYRTNLIPVRGADGGIRRVIALCGDITDLRQQQNLLDETESVARVGGWHYDVAALRLAWTPGVYRIFERDPSLPPPSMEESIALYIDDHIPAIRHAFTQAVSTGAGFEFTAQARLASGRLITVHAIGQTETIAGRVVRVFGAVQDISAQEESEQQRLRLEAQLRRAQKMEAVGTLAGGIAHDFNNILAGIMGNIQLAGLEMGDDAPPRRFLDKSYQGCIRARDLVRRILTFSRQAEQPRSVSALRPIIEEAVELLRASLPASVAIESVFSADSLHSLVDPGQIHQVILNLGANAAHAMQPGGGLLSIELAARPPADAWSVRFPQVQTSHRVRLTVRDTGCGIPPATLERIFEPFYTTKPPGEGSGLGLAMVHGIVETHGGVIAVESTVGAGTAFHLFLPGQIRTDPGRDSGAVPSPSTPSGEGQTIMVVDDEPVIAALTEPILKHLGYQTRVFHDPLAALEAFHAVPHAFAAVLSDFSMPGIDGLAFAGTLHALRPELPIILMTGYLKPSDQQSMRDAGIRHLLPKPFTMQHLAATLHEALPRPAAS